MKTAEKAGLRRVVVSNRLKRDRNSEPNKSVFAGYRLINVFRSNDDLPVCPISEYGAELLQDTEAIVIPKVIGDVSVQDDAAYLLLRARNPVAIPVFGRAKHDAKMNIPVRVFCVWCMVIRDGQGIGPKIDESIGEGCDIFGEHTVFRVA